jgi:hypothetical protein
LAKKVAPVDTTGTQLNPVEEAVHAFGGRRPE